MEQIDQYNLDRECFEHPRDYHKAAVALSAARYAEAEAKQALDLLKAQLSAVIREDYVSYGFDKAPTVAALADAIVEQGEYQEALTTHLAAQHQRDLAQNVVGALDARRRMIQAAIDLLKMDYFSTVDDTPTRRDAVGQQAASRVETTLGRRRTRRGESDG